MKGENNRMCKGASDWGEGETVNGLVTSEADVQI